MSENSVYWPVVYFIVAVISEEFVGELGEADSLLASYDQRDQFDAVQLNPAHLILTKKAFFILRAIKHNR